MIPGTLSKTDINHGPFVYNLCPMCGESTLSLYECSTTLNWSMIFRLFSLPYVLALVCSSCKYKKDIPKKDVEKVLELHKEYQDLRDGLLDKDEFLKRLSDYKLDCLEELIQENKKVFCPNCSEEVPAGFDVCWNCETSLGTFSAQDEAINKKVSVKNDPVLGTSGYSIEKE